MNTERSLSLVNACMIIIVENCIIDSKADSQVLPWANFQLRFQNCNLIAFLLYFMLTALYFTVSNRASHTLFFWC